MLLHTDVFTQTQIAQKLVRTYRIYTQPTFTQRGFASLSWSPTFRVPPLKLNIEVWAQYFYVSVLCQVRFYVAMWCSVWSLQQKAIEGTTALPSPLLCGKMSSVWWIGMWPVFANDQISTIRLVHWLATKRQPIHSHGIFVPRFFPFLFWPRIGWWEESSPVLPRNQCICRFLPAWFFRRFLKSRHFFSISFPAPAEWQVPMAVSCGQYHTAVICVRDQDSDDDRISGSVLACINQQ